MTTAASPGTLAAAWPELQADPARAAAYAAALEGLDPAAVAAVSDALRREGRPLPKPGVLRVAVLARAPRAPTGPPPPLRPPPPPPAVAHRPATGPARQPLGIALALSGLGVVLTIGAAETPWARTPRGTEVAGKYVGAAELVSRAELLALAVTIIGAVYVWRSRSPRHLVQAFGLLTVAHLVAALAAIRGHWQITDLPGLSVAPSYWAAPVGAVIGTGAAAWGWFQASRGEDPRARAAATRRTIRRWLIIGAILCALGGAAVVAIAASGGWGSDDGTRAESTAASARAAATREAARAEYAALLSGRGRAVTDALAVLRSATQQGDPAGALRGLRLTVTSLEAMRDGLSAARALNRPPFDRATGRLTAGLSAQARAARALLEGALAGRPPAARDVAAINAADRVVVAADRELRAALGIPIP